MNNSVTQAEIFKIIRNVETPHNLDSNPSVRKSHAKRVFAILLKAGYTTEQIKDASEKFLNE